jgi:hypothetical protein
MIKFDTINGQLCPMLEKPIPLTPEAKFPCAVRLIQDSSPMGRYNNRLADGGRLLPFICNGIKENHIQKDGKSPYFEYAYECYETIGYPVADHSAEWALYHMMQGDVVCQKDSNFKRYYKNGNVCWLDMAGIERSLTTDLFLKNFANTIDWQIYIEQPKPEPIVSCIKCDNKDKCPHYDDKLDHCIDFTTKPEPKVQVGHPEHPFKNGMYLKTLGDNACWKIVDSSVPNMVETICLSNGQVEWWLPNQIGNVFKILSPAEVVVTIGCLSGTVRSRDNKSFHLLRKGKNTMVIYFDALDTPTRKLVRELIEKQEGENK